MPDVESLVILDGLSSLQAEELRTALSSTPEVLSEQPRPALGGTKHGEPTLLALAVAAAPHVLAVLAIWLAKQKRRRVQKLRYRVRAADGSETLVALDLSEHAEGESSAAAIEAVLRGALGAKPS